MTLAKGKGPGHLCPLGCFGHSNAHIMDAFLVWWVILKLRKLRSRGLNEPAQGLTDHNGHFNCSYKRGCHQWWQNSGSSLTVEQSGRGPVTSGALLSLHPFAEERFLVRTVLRVRPEHKTWGGVWEPGRRCNRSPF